MRKASNQPIVGQTALVLIRRDDNGRAVSDPYSVNTTLWDKHQIEAKKAKKQQSAPKAGIATGIIFLALSTLIGLTIIKGSALTLAAFAAGVTTQPIAIAFLAVAVISVLTITIAGIHLGCIKKPYHRAYSTFKRAVDAEEEQRTAVTYAPGAEKK